MVGSVHVDVNLHWGKPRQAEQHRKNTLGQVQALGQESGRSAATSLAVLDACNLQGSLNWVNFSGPRARVRGNDGAH